LSRRWLVPFGTRPEIVKLAPVVEAMRAAGANVHTLATGQHHDPRLADEFFDDLALVPDTRWELPSDEFARLAALFGRACETLAPHEFDALLLLGDTYTVPLFALAARRFGLPVVHAEAGLRSFNPQSIEEGNRRVVASLAALHLAPTDLAARMLDAEGVAPERVLVVGNPVTDSLRVHGPPACPVADRHGVVVTMHRPTNVDDPERLRALVGLVCNLARDFGRVRFPVHPRTRDRLERAGIRDLEATPGVQLEAPLRYGEMLAAVASARAVVTDSGGLQEEAAWYGVPTVVLRTTTPRWESVLAGTSALVGVDADRALAAVHGFSSPDEQRRIAAVPCPYGDGHAGTRIASVLHDAATQRLLEVAEPGLDETVMASLLPGMRV
jgi:UDP-N-acetylglucosamine 2-epimerase (non-hydrolysing)